jgi:TetR/AcrR family transcriptional regulator
MALRAQPARRRPARPGPRGDSEQTRAAILKAALEEFAQEGLAGARIDHIARTARVNKALLYYYFHDKEALYGAALDQVFSELSAKLIPVLEQPLDPRQKMLAYAGAHFDFIAASPIYPRLVQREMMRAGRAGSPHIQRLAERYLRPIQLRLLELFREGAAAGAFRPVDPNHFIVSVVAMNVFYFSSLPMLRLLTGGDPLDPERVAARRAAVLDFVAAALFTAPREALASSDRGSDAS